MKIKNDFKKFWPHIIVGSFLLFLLVLFGILDLTIVLSFDTYSNWFSIGFDMWGVQAITIPIGITLIFSLITITNRFYKNNDHILKGSLFGLSISIIVILLFETYRFYSYFDSSKDYKDNIEFISSIIIFVIALASFVCATLLINKVDVFKDPKFQKTLWVRVLIAITFILITTSLTTIMKEIWGRPRPNAVVENKDLFKYIFEFNLDGNKGKSFPSGHTQASGMFLMLVYFVPKIDKKNIWINSIILFSILSMVLTGISRIVYHKHFPTDVTFAMTLVSIFYLLVPKTINWIIKNNG